MTNTRNQNYLDIYLNTESFEELINYKRIKNFMERYKWAIKSYSALRKVLEKYLALLKKNERNEITEGELLDEFINWVRYQEWRNNWLLDKWLTNKLKSNERKNYEKYTLSSLIEQVLEKINNNDNKLNKLKTWLQAIVANYVYFKWTKN